MNDIKFLFSDNNSRPRANLDHVSGLVITIANPNNALGIKVASLADFDNSPYKTEIHARYQVSEFFRIAGEGAELWIFHLGAFNAETIRMVQGRIRQLGVCDVSDLGVIAATVATWQAFAVTMSNAYRTPLHIIIAPKTATAAQIDNALDLRGLNAPDVSVLINGDGSGRGNTISAVDYTPAMGATIGLLAARKVSESIAWVEKCRIDDGIEYQTARFADNKASKSLVVLQSLDEKGYLYLGKYPHFDGVYLNDSNTCAAATADLAYIENNRLLHKVKRELRAALLPVKNSPLAMDKKGAIAIGYLRHLQSVVEKPLAMMRQNSELSDFQVVIAGNSVATTGELTIQCSIIPIATLRKPQVKIDFITTINSLT
jgi:hypothetical protein